MLMMLDIIYWLSYVKKIEFLMFFWNIYATVKKYICSYMMSQII